MPHYPTRVLGLLACSLRYIELGIAKKRNGGGTMPSSKFPLVIQTYQ